MMLLDVLSAGLLLCSAFFFLAGTLGVLRFPDALARLHAVTKADNLGLGLLIAALALQADSLFIVGKLILVWLLVLLASATSCYLIASQGTDAPEEGG